MNMKMESFLRFFTVSIASACILLSFPHLIHAQSSQDIPTKHILSALNSEYDAYSAYAEFIENIESYTGDEIRNEYSLQSNEWATNFSDARDVYIKYSSNEGYEAEIQSIAQVALSGSEKALEALENYDRALLTDNLTDDGFDDAIDRGDELMMEAVADHDKAVEGINDYSGASGEIELLDWLIVLAIISGFLSLILFFKSRSDSIYKADIIRAEIYRDLLVSSLWMFFGFLVTAGGLYYALYHGGGEYYILYGAVVVGGWKFTKSLWKYWFQDRAVLRELKSESRKKMISDVLKNIKSHE